MRLGGKPLIVIVSEIISSISDIDNIIITVPENIEYYTNLIKSYNIKNFICIIGGKTRQESTYLALQYCNSDRVLIHESARPFITSKHIKDLISIDADVVVPCIPIIPTIASKKQKYLNRDELVNVQLPQIFNTDILKHAHEKAIGKNYTDDSSLLWHEFKIFPKLIRGLEENIKITTKYDVLTSEVIFNETIGFDNWG